MRRGAAVRTVYDVVQQRRGQRAVEPQGSAAPRRRKPHAVGIVLGGSELARDFELVDRRRDQRARGGTRHARDPDCRQVLAPPPRHSRQRRRVRPELHGLLRATERHRRQRARVKSAHTAFGPELLGDGHRVGRLRGPLVAQRKPG